jgi:hypothetical protein
VQSVRFIPFFSLYIWLVLTRDRISQNNNNAAGGTSSISQIVWVQNGNIVTCCISSITMQEG